MSNIWNPHAFGVTGQPVGPQVNTLRVYGAEPSKEQLAMAQQTFAKFCMTERLSFAPNQTQQGFLPDGSKYRIVVVGNTRIMEMALEGAEDDYVDNRGVGVSTGSGAGMALFLVAFKDGVWGFIRPEKMYGGPGLWVSLHSDLYLTDNTHKVAPVGGFGPRRYPLDGSVVIPDAAATTNAGFAYDDANGGVGIITPALRYVQVAASRSGSVLKIDVSDAAVASEQEVLETPDEPAKNPTHKSTAQVSVPGASLLAPDGGAAHYRLRSGGEVGFPTTDSYLELVPPLLGSSGPLSRYHISGLLQATFPEEGGHSAHWSPSGIEGVDPAASGQLKLIKTRDQRYDVLREPRRYALPGITYDVGHQIREVWVNSGGYGSSTVGGFAPVNPEFLFVIESTKHTIERKDAISLSAKGGVLISRDWADSPVEFTVDRDFEYTVKAKLVDETGERDLPHDLTVSFPPDEEIRESGPGTVYYYEKRALSHWGLPSPAELVYTSTTATEADTKYKGTSVLKTPWGSIDLLDCDLTGVDRKVVNNVPYEVFTDTFTLSGHYTQRFVLHADPVLGAVAYIEAHLEGFRDVQTGGATATTARIKFVIDVRGVKVFEDERVVENLFLQIPILKFSYGFLVELPEGPRTYSTRVVGCPAPAMVHEYSAYRLDPPDGSFFQHEDESLTLVDVIATTNETSWICDKQTENVSVSDAPKLTITNPEATPIPKFRALSAVDPNSGGGVILAIIDGQVHGAWTVAPNGQPSELAALIGVAPQALNPSVISV